MWCIEDYTGWSFPNKGTPDRVQAGRCQCALPRSNAADRPTDFAAATTIRRSQRRFVESVSCRPPANSPRWQAAHQSRGGGGVMRRMRIELPFGGARRPQFTVQPAQTFHIVNIVPRRQHVHFQLKFARPFQRLRGNALGAPGDFLE